MMDDLLGKALRSELNLDSQKAQAMAAMKAGLTVVMRAELMALEMADLTVDYLAWQMRLQSQHSRTLTFLPMISK